MSDRLMSSAQQAADYERVNGASDRARAQEVRDHGPGGYRGDPGQDAAERRAERQGDATMQRIGPFIVNGDANKPPQVTQEQRDAGRSQASAAAAQVMDAGRQAQPSRSAAVER